MRRLSRNSINAAASTDATVNGANDGGNGASKQPVIDEDGWEDLGPLVNGQDEIVDDDEQDDDGVALRDAQFEENEEESDFMPSEVEPLSEESPSELEDEDISMDALLTSTIFARKKAAEQAQVSNSSGDIEFDEDDKAFWATPDEKKQWIERYHAANREFMQQYGCRIDSGAFPDAKTKLLREKKQHNKYSLMLLVIAIAYIVQLVYVYSNTGAALEENPTTMQQVKEDPLPERASTSTKVAPVPPPKPQQTPQTTKATQDKKLPVKPVDKSVQEPKPTAKEIKQPPSGTKETIKQPINAPKAPAATKISTPEHSKPTAKQPAPDTTGKPQRTDSAPSDVHKPSSTPVKRDTGTQAQMPSATAKAPVPTKPAAATKAAPTTPSPHSELEKCNKLVSKLVKTTHNDTVKAATIRACDAAVESAQQQTTTWTEALVRRGDLWSLLSDFDAASRDYNRATTATAVLRRQPRSSQEIQLKLMSNRWIQRFVNKQYKELRQECEAVAQNQAFSQELRTLATDWLRAFRREIKAIEVLTQARRWTLQPVTFAQNEK